MPDIASVLKAEVVRLARKELRAETGALRKALAAQRSEIAAVKRRVQELERTLKKVNRSAAASRSVSEEADSDVEDGRVRFRAGGMASNRRRLGLSASDFGLLVGATGQSVYAWESGKTKPRQQNLVAIAALRKVGKREVEERLTALKQTSS